MKGFEVGEHMPNTGCMLHCWRNTILCKERRLTQVTGYGPLIREYVFFLESKLAFHRQHPEFNGECSF